ncbi:MAG TPA: peptidoglycan DD-metalloendopeptidase family protein [Burkholderiaceae bacterium]|nr:peptidoglycan DD-metalloendopeptidase family protein [Burkholderiaceae bacterium]
MSSLPLHPSTVRALAAACVALALAACASRPPAPIVVRTVPGAPAGRPADAPRPAEPAAAPAPPPAAEAPPVETAPIRGGAVESRSIESRPLDARPSAPPPAPAAPALPPNTRTAPRGGKVPFSDTALADLRAAESAPSTSAPSAAAPPAAAGTAPVAPGPSAAVPPASPAAPASANGGDWAWPATGRVIQSFDESTTKGIVLGGKVGDPVLAAADGRVIFSGNGPRGYGNLVIVKHEGELLSVYAHNRALSVKEGQAVKRGQKIAELGDSGTTSPRLHFEIRQQGKPVDPARFLPRR